MSELIAIPLESDRRAVHVLAALQWLEAEYRGRLERTGTATGTAAPDGGSVIPPAGKWDRLRRVGRHLPVSRLHVSVLAALAGAVAGAAVALLSEALMTAVPVVASVPAYLVGAAIGALLGAATGALLGMFAGAALKVLFPATPQRTQDIRTVTWLISYIMRDGPAESGRLRGTVLQITLPVEAEAQLKAILARVDTTVAR
jgi:uncharacterized membrane protein